MGIIDNMLGNLEKQYPNTSPKYILRRARHAIGRSPKKRTRKENRYILAFSIALFEVLLPDTMLDAITKTVEPKIRKRLLTVRMLLLSLIVYNLSPEIKSYNDLIRELSIRLKYLLPEGVDAVLSKGSFTYQLTTRSPRIFRSILIYLLNQIMEHVNPQTVNFKGKYTVRAMDYSVFDLPPSLAGEFKTARNQTIKTKVQCRAHMVFDTVKKIIENFSLTDARANEKKNFNTLIEPFLNQCNIIWVCDLGYWAFWIMDKIMEYHQHFVFRLRQKAVYTIIKVLDPDHEDYLVQLGSPKNHRKHKMDHLVRLVACPQEGSEIYYYVTSLLDPQEFSSQEIRALYRDRWGIELFFFDLKHILEFEPASKSGNGIEIEFYGALITHTFVKIIIMDAADQHHVSPNDISFSETYQTVNSWIREKHKIFSDAPVEKVREEYEALLAFIAKNCISETVKKRLVKEQQQQQLLQAA